MDSYIFAILYKLTDYSLPLNPTIHRMGNTGNTLDFISELINLKYAFNIPFKITLKTIIMGASSKFHDGVQLNILATLSLRDTAPEMGSKEAFVKAWSSLLNNNGNLFK